MIRPGGDNDDDEKAQQSTPYYYQFDASVKTPPPAMWYRGDGVVVGSSPVEYDDDERAAGKPRGIPGGIFRKRVSLADDYEYGDRTDIERRSEATPTFSAVWAGVSFGKRGGGGDRQAKQTSKRRAVRPPLLCKSHENKSFFSPWTNNHRAAGTALKLNPTLSTVLAEDDDDESSTFLGCSGRTTSKSIEGFFDDDDDEEEENISIATLSISGLSASEKEEERPLLLLLLTSKTHWIVATAVLINVVVAVACIALYATVGI
mmetsp:Transcript_29390/g.61219  ORF Transcript_29390/g.61219 Transcript_29390/m.61219 type:complete len:261 (+) Transcript_29390:286-1068(+)